MAQRASGNVQEHEVREGQYDMMEKEESKGIKFGLAKVVISRE